MAARKKHTLLWIAGAGVGAFAVYEWLYKPWAAQQAALVASGALPASTNPLSSLFPSLNLPAPASMLSTTPAVGPVPSTGAPVGGVVGACMAKKGFTWTQTQCQTRLDALVSAATNARSAIAQLQSATSNPAAAGIPAAQAQLAATQAALATATDSYNKLLAAGDTNGAATFHAAMLAHQSDIADLTARIAAAGTANDNSAAIAAYQGQLAANDADYFALTGSHLIGGA